MMIKKISKINKSIKPAVQLVFILLCSFSAKAQIQFPAIDVQHYDFAIQLNDTNDTIKGKATVKIKFLKDVPGFALNLIKTNSKGKGMLVSAVTGGGKKIAFVQDSDVVHINTGAKMNSLHSYTITYQGIPADGLIISKNEFGHRTFFGDNWPNRAHNWLPCADYPADKASVDFVVTAPDHYQVVANGLKTGETLLPNHLKLTHWTETAQLPTKVMVIGVAEFAIDHTGDVGKIPVYTYVFPESKTAGFKSYAVAKEILRFYIKKIGPYAYKKLANVQSKTVFGGMENAGAIFYFENSVTDGGIEELMAHEIAHQWFGDAASEKSFAHLWLSEGFATYMTNVYLENKYGPDTLKKRLITNRATVFRFEKKRLTPVVDTAVKSNFMQLLNANSYQKGGWVLHILHKKLGDALFWKGIRNYYAKYNGRNAGTDDFRKVMEQTSGQNLKQFFKQWLYTPGHPRLSISWKYNAAASAVELNVIQKQNDLSEFPLEILIGQQLFTVQVKGKSTDAVFKVSGKPTAIKVDPNINLLADFEVTEEN
ncbi:MAG: M1 family metallopeptidase [Sphingobacteriales bacterium]